jgi:membrane protease YdiL (CAAX protease family)
MLYTKKLPRHYLKKQCTVSFQMILSGIKILFLIILLSLLFSRIWTGKALFVFPSKSSWSTYTFFFVWIFLSCLFEEILYRFYLPDALTSLLSFISVKLQKNLTPLFFYALPSVIFGLAHLYNGLPGILFSSLSAVLFLILKKKYNNILLNTAVHFSYNVFSYMIMQKYI